MRFFVLALRVFLLASLYQANTQARAFSLQDEEKIQVTQIIDGDTFYGNSISTREHVKVRLYGIDTPERNRKGYQEAKDELTRLISKQIVKIVRIEIDKYKRVVAKVFKEDETYVNAELISKGLARWFKKYAPYERDLRQLERQAKLERIGLWEGFFSEF